MILKHRTQAWLLTMTSLMITAVAIAGTPVDITSSIAAAEPLAVSDGRYQVTLSLWSQRERGELLWEKSFPEVLVRDGRLCFHVTPFLDERIDVTSTWVQAIIDDRTVSDRVAVAASTDQFTELGDFGLRFYNPLGVHDPAPFAQLTAYQPTNSLVLSSGTGGIIDFSQSRVDGGGSWSGTVFAIDQNGRAVASGGWDAGLENGSGFLMIGDSESSTSVVFDDNEIQARDNGVASTLHLNYHGGDVKVGNTIIGSSDRRQKQDIEALEHSLEKIHHLQPVSFEWRNDPGSRRLGLIAQDVRGVVDEVVYEDEEGMLGLAYDGLIPVLIQAIQEQQAQIDNLCREVERLKEKTVSLPR